LLVADLSPKKEKEQKRNRGSIPWMSSGRPSDSYDDILATCRAHGGGGGVAGGLPIKDPNYSLFLTSSMASISHM
jgi:hypothetical protein